MRTVLIPSGAYVTSAMQAEFGRTPPVFLSVAHKTLLFHQVQMLREAGKADLYLLTLPEDYEINDRRRAEITDLGLEIVQTPTGLSLCEAMSFALNAGSWHHDELRILMGDTLINGLNLDRNDHFETAPPPFAGEWTVFDPSEPGAFATRFCTDAVNVVSGYLSFSSTREWLRAITLARYDFAKSMTLYHRRRPLTSTTQGPWFDFGRIQTYYQSRRTFTTQRHFNELEISRHTVRKRSQDKAKMRAEAQWFEQLPTPLRLFTPAMLNHFEEDNSAGYELEYLHMLPLNECFSVFDLPLDRWRTIVSACRLFLESCRAHVITPDLRLNALYGEKTNTRLEQFCKARGIDAEHPWQLNGVDAGSLASAARKAAALIPPVQEACVMHGDFCFSNILFDTRSSLIKVIDPRGGADVAEPNIFGDPRYDLAKLHHSFEGLYDLILAGQASFEMSTPYDARFEIDVTPKQERIAHMFRDAFLTSDPAQADTINAISVMLFLSMLPLHADNPPRQIMLAMNALRLAASLPE